jgi:hypothetical protein
MKTVLDIVSWTIVAAIVVLLVMNAKSVASIVTSVGGFWSTETSMFTGAGYTKASGKAFG